MSDGSVEILGARERRRRWSVGEKLRIVAECDEPGASLRAVAARHDIYPTLLGTWRRQARRGHFIEAQSPRLVPIRIAESRSSAPCTSAPADTAAPTGVIEIRLPNGCQVRVGNDVSLATLRRVISVLRG
jgi:transposase